MTPKELKKLAAACRSAGILTFKNSEVEFTLSETKLTKNTRKRSVGAASKETTEIADDIAEENALTQDQLLMWSVGGADTVEGIN